jgi:hypothetical protein
MIHWTRLVGGGAWVATTVMLEEKTTTSWCHQCKCELEVMEAASYVVVVAPEEGC